MSRFSLEPDPQSAPSLFHTLGSAPSYFHPQASPGDPTTLGSLHASSTVPVCLYYYCWNAGDPEPVTSNIEDDLRPDPYRTTASPLNCRSSVRWEAFCLQTVRHRVNECGRRGRAPSASLGAQQLWL